MTQLMLRKNFTWIALLLVVSGLLAACQSSASQTSVTSNESASSAMVAEAATVAPVTPASAEEASPANREQTTAAAGVTQTFLFGEGTEARFYLDEVLMGQDKNVVGVTSLVEGQITLDPSAPASAQISPIRIDASTFTTDSDRRNGAIQRFILQSSQAEYQYITFEPTAITDLPAAVTIGEPFEFTVTGNLTIRDITREETFQVTVTPISENAISGLGTTTILRANYELTIPSVPSVANVSEEVKLEIVFAATAS